MVDTVGERLDAALRRNGMRAPDLARAVGVTKAAVYKWIRNEAQPEPKNWQSIASALPNEDIGHLRDGKKPGREIDEEQFGATLETLHIRSSERGFDLSIKQLTRIAFLIHEHESVGTVLKLTDAVIDKYLMLGVRA